MTMYVIAWFWAFAFTQLIEVPLYVRLLDCSVLRAFGATALTHPLIWLGFARLPFSYLWMAMLAELFAWLVEALYFARPYGMRRALWISLLANTASCALGLLSRRLFGAP